MKASPSLSLALAAALLLPACAAAAQPALAPPADTMYFDLREACPQPPAKAPTVEELARLFYEIAPEHAGEEVVVIYGYVEEHTRQARPRGYSYVATGRRFGKARVLTREFVERTRRQPVLGGGMLRVIFDLETGRIISAERER